MTVKVCTKCKNSLPLSEFHRDKNRKDGLCLWCKPCSIANARRYYNSGPLDPSERRKSRPKLPAEEVARRSRINTARNVMRKQYGITYEQYESMYLEQDGRCLICEQKKPRLSVDHCHKTGNVRGLLCKNCNVAIGMLNDNAILVERARKYLTGTWS